MLNSPFKGAHSPLRFGLNLAAGRFIGREGGDTGAPQRTIRTQPPQGREWAAALRNEGGATDRSPYWVGVPLRRTQHPGSGGDRSS